MSAPKDPDAPKVKIMERLIWISGAYLPALSRITPCEAEQLVLVPRWVGEEYVNAIMSEIENAKLMQWKAPLATYEDKLARVREYLKAQETP